MRTVRGESIAARRPSGSRSSWNDGGGVKPNARMGSTARSVALTRNTDSASWRTIACIRCTVESSTSSRSSEAGNVWATRCSEKSNELASARRLTRSSASCCWRAASRPARWVSPLVNATSPSRSGPQQAVAVRPFERPDLVDVLGRDSGDRRDTQLGAEEPAGGEPGEHAAGDEAQRER